MNSIYLGFDPREAAAFAVARHSIKRHLTQPIPVHGLVLSDLQAKGLYTRPIEWRPSAADKPIMWDVISDAPMSTQHANARFLVYHLARENSRIRFNAVGGQEVITEPPNTGWALFADGDILARGNLARVFSKLDASKAVFCVHHDYTAKVGGKMDGQVQTSYSRKNWSSVLLFNLGHEANKALTLEMVNTLPGRDLHRLCWLDDSEIGKLGPEWNYLVGHTKANVDPVIVHFTEGLPDMPTYENVPYADQWRSELAQWAA